MPIWQTSTKVHSAPTGGLVILCTRMSTVPVCVTEEAEFSARPETVPSSETLLPDTGSALTATEATGTSTLEFSSRVLENETICQTDLTTGVLPEKGCGRPPALKNAWISSGMKIPSWFRQV